MKPHKLILNGAAVSRREFLRRRVGGGGVARINQTYQEHKPLVSEGLGVLPHQVKEAREICRDAGLTGVRVLDSGAVEFTSRGDRGRRGLLKLRGKIDNDGGYGDG
jgi:hypothetical protein